MEHKRPQIVNSHEVKRRLLLGRKVMTNLHSILKSRTITLPTKVCLVKAMVFPVVMYWCESWTIKKAERRRIDAFELWCWRRLLRVPWTARRSNQSILKEISPGCSLEELMLQLKLQYFGHLMRRVDSLEKTLTLGRIEGGRRGRQRMRWLMAAGSQNTRSHPWQGHEEKTWQARQIRTSRISKSCPGAHLKDDLCLSDACYIRLLPNFCDTGRRPSPTSLQTEST